MDTLGAVLDPSLALLYFYPKNYKSLFYIAFIPGLLAVGASFLLKKQKKTNQIKPQPTPFFSFLHYWKKSPTMYRKVVIGLLAFTLFNSSDVFLLLKAKESGASDTIIIGIYIFYNLVYATFAFPLGLLADRIGLKKMLISGIGIFTIVYFGMGFNHNIYIFLALFALYGIYAAASEGVSKAWISNITDKKDTATAIGTYSAFLSVCAILASSLAGLIWYQFGANATFIVTGTASVLILFYFVFMTNEKKATDI